jgi:hypothetical protein
VRLIVDTPISLNIPTGPVAGKGKGAVGGVTTPGSSLELELFFGPPQAQREIRRMVVTARELYLIGYLHEVELNYIQLIYLITAISVFLHI